MADRPVRVRWRAARIAALAALAALAACVAVLGAACGDSTGSTRSTVPTLRDTRPQQSTPDTVATTTTPAPTTNPPPTSAPPLAEDHGIALRAAEELDEDQIAEVIHGITAARALMGESGPVDVFLFWRPETFAQDYVARFRPPGGIEQATFHLARASLASSIDGRGVIFLNGPGIFHRHPTGRRAFVTAAHEAVHTVQMGRSLVLPSPVASSDRPPSWLIEGQAELVAWWLALERGVLDHQTWEEVRTQIQHWAVWEDRPLAATSLQIDHGVGDPTTVYGRSTFAAEWLADRAGFDSFWEFWVIEEEWPLAFELAFGLPLAEFYEQFAAWEAEGYPSLGL